MFKIFLFMYVISRIQVGNDALSPSKTIAECCSWLIVCAEVPAWALYEVLMMQTKEELQFWPIYNQ